MGKNPRLYKIYDGMKQRCTNPNYPRSKDYMGRGITICEEWMKSYQSFKRWALNNGYSEELSIDRIENKKGYSPDNCRWVTITEQTNNRSTNTKYAFNGKTHTLSEWSKIYNLNYDTVLTRFANGKRGNELFKPTGCIKNDSNFEDIKYSDSTLMGWSKKKLILYINSFYEVAEKLKGAEENEIN